MNAYTNQYMVNTIKSASPEQLLLMLYDGAIRFAALGVKAIDANDFEKRSYYVNKTSAIISELAATLDHSLDPDFADNLDALYHYMLNNLMDANLKHDTRPLLEVKKMLGELRETWSQAMEINRSQKQKESVPIPAAAAGPASCKPLAVAM